MSKTFVCDECNRPFDKSMFLTLKGKRNYLVTMIDPDIQIGYADICVDCFKGLVAKL
jgi:hypothetical protein